jgi:signal transduction histidine kinase
VSSGIDITSRSQLEERNLELAVEREKVRIIGNFVRDASHDFRTPLSILNTNLYLLRKSQDREQQAQRIVEMEKQVMQLNDLLDQLITMTRLDTGTEQNMTRVNLNELVRDVYDRVYSAARDKNLTARLVMDDSIPPLEVDIMQLSQALNNFVSNSIQYTPEGGDVVIETSLRGDQAAVEIRDTGIGIPAKDLPYIFDRFFRTDPARSRTTGGSGLGLPIAKKIVELHGGKILVESTLGAGSTFTILLPIPRK